MKRLNNYSIDLMFLKVYALDCTAIFLRHTLKRPSENILTIQYF